MGIEAEPTMLALSPIHVCFLYLGRMCAFVYHVFTFTIIICPILMYFGGDEIDFAAFMFILVIVVPDIE